MKKIRTAALALCMTLLLSGCGVKPQARNLQNIRQAMLDADVLPDMVAVPESMELDFYGIEPDWYEEAVFMVASDSLLVDEVVMFRARDDAAAKRIHQMLKSRMDAKLAEARTYSPEQYAVITRGHMLLEGREGVMLVCPGADKLLSIYQGD